MHDSDASPQTAPTVTCRTADPKGGDAQSLP